MGVTLKKQRDGKNWRPFWYADYTDENGKREVINLDIKWHGQPPRSGSLRNKGNPEFEASRKEAEDALAERVENIRHKGRAEHLTERLIESKTGRAVSYVKIVDLPTRWRNMGRERSASEEHLANTDAHFRRFIEFMKTQNSDATFLYEVTPEDAGAFVTALRESLAPATAQYGFRLLAKAHERFLPVGAANPFADFIGRRTHGESGVVHRQPFSPAELRALLAHAIHDDFMYPLIVTAMCTGMRRADVCELRWSAVDLVNGMITVKTGKTDARVEIPIFKPLRDVLDARHGNGNQFVFPEAARMLADNADGLSYRFKVMVARALDNEKHEPLPEPTPASDIEGKAFIAIKEHVPAGHRRDRLLDTFRRYAAGESVRKITTETGISKGTISYDLHLVENWTDSRFMRSAQSPSIKQAIARVTRTSRGTHGQKAASIKDWHALRTTFVTLALSAGVPMELVRRVTGHATVEVVLKNYFRPDREQFKAALTLALPDVLTGDKTPTKSELEELAALSQKLTSGALTDAEKKRFRTLATQV